MNFDIYDVAEWKVGNHAKGKVIRGSNGLIEGFEGPNKIVVRHHDGFWIPCRS